MAFIARRLPFALIVGLMIWAAAFGLVAVINAATDDSVCQLSFLLIDCRLDGQTSLKPGAYLGALVFCLVALGITHAALRRRAIYPFLNFVLYGAVACILFDYLFKIPVKDFGPLFSGMFNSTNFIIALSFLFFSTVIRVSPTAVFRFTLAAVMSYGQTVLGFAIYFWLHEGFLGATTIYLGFAIYAFGVFSIHLMSVFAMVAAIEGKAERPLSKQVMSKRALGLLHRRLR